MTPLVAMLNTFLNTTMLGGMMNDGNTKTVKIHGHKARLEKNRAMKKVKMITNYKYHSVVP